MVLVQTHPTLTFWTRDAAGRKLPSSRRYRRMTVMSATRGEWHGRGEIERQANLRVERDVVSHSPFPLSALGQATATPRGTGDVAALRDASQTESQKHLVPGASPCRAVACETAASQMAEVDEVSKDGARDRGAVSLAVGRLRRRVRAAGSAISGSLIGVKGQPSGHH